MKTSITSSTSAPTSSAFSGGKGLQGPQGAGIIAGRQDLIDAVIMQSAPNHGIGRVCKVSKEEVVGQVASLIWWAEQDEEERMIEHHRKSGLLNRMVEDIGGAKDRGGVSPITANGRTRPST